MHIHEAMTFHADAMTFYGLFICTPFIQSAFFIPRPHSLLAAVTTFFSLDSVPYVAPSLCPFCSALLWTGEDEIVVV